MMYVYKKAAIETNVCPFCHAAPMEPCRSMASGRTTDVHSGRWLPLAEAYWAGWDECQAYVDTKSKASVS
jgi:hypothetical protein